MSVNIFLMMEILKQIERDIQMIKVIYCMINHSITTIIMKKVNFNYVLSDILLIKYTYMLITLCVFSAGSTKKIKKANVKELFEQHTSDYSSIQERMLKVENEKLLVAKEELHFKKEAHQQQIEVLTTLLQKMDELTSIAQSIAPQYLQD